MDSQTKAELKSWLREVRLNDCNEYIVIAINEKREMIGSAQSSYESMLEMLGSFAKQNQAFKQVLISAACYFITKENAEKKGEMPC